MHPRSSDPRQPLFRNDVSRARSPPVRWTRSRGCSKRPRNPVVSQSPSSSRPRETKCDLQRLHSRTQRDARFALYPTSHRRAAVSFSLSLFHTLILSLILCFMYSLPSFLSSFLFLSPFSSSRLYEKIYIFPFVTLLSLRYFLLPFLARLPSSSSSFANLFRAVRVLSARFHRNDLTLNEFLFLSDFFQIIFLKIDERLLENFTKVFRNLFSENLRRLTMAIFWLMLIRHFLFGFSKCIESLAILTKQYFEDKKQ